jgi:SEC-C motif
VAGGPWPVGGFDPARYEEVPVPELLQAAARGWIGVDRRLVHSILNRGEGAVADTLAFAREGRGEDAVDLETLLVDLFRHWGTPEAVDFFIGAIRRNPEEVEDDLIQALLPLADRAVEPLLALYEELGEEQGTDIAFLLAGLHVRDPRVLAVLLDRLEFDASDGAFCLELYGDPAARPALEKMLAEVPADAPGVRRDLSNALAALATTEAPPYEPHPFDILAEYPAEELPEFDLLTETERTDLLSSPDAKVRAGAAHSFFNADLQPKERARLLDLAQGDTDAAVRGRAWEALADASEDAAVREAMMAVLTDSSRPVIERGGAAVGLYGVADRDEVSRAIEALYEESGEEGKSVARAKALEAMWRSLWKPFAKHFPPHLDDKNPTVLRQALRGTGYFRLTGYADKIARYFEPEDFDLPADVREDALFSYALAMPGETTRGRIRGMLRKIEAITSLTPWEGRLVMFGLDERLRLHGLAPFFEDETEFEDQPEPESSAPQKVGRNDPCPCGSGKKYKKCCGQ